MLFIMNPNQVMIGTLIETKTNTFYNEDVREVIKWIPDESIDLIVSDPPYLINYQSNRRVATEKFQHMQGDTDPELISWYFKECYRTLKNNTSCYIFCSWKTVDFFKVEFEKHFNLKNILVWDKGIWGSGDLKGSYGPQHEFILYGHKGRDTLRHKRYPDIIKGFNKVPSAKLLHPAQKPTHLLCHLIQNSSNVEDLVFDGFAGIGSTGVACKHTNRKFLMCEINKEYYEIGANLLK